MSETTTPPSEPRLPMTPPSDPTLPTPPPTFWHASHLPEGWERLGAEGLRRAGDETPPANVVFAQGALEAEASLPDYRDRQIDLLGQILLRPELRQVPAPPVEGAEEGLGVEIRYARAGIALIQEQWYVRRGRQLGVVTFTTTPEERAALRDTFDAIAAGLVFAPPAEAAR